MTYTDFPHYLLLSLCIGHPPVTGNFYAQRASHADGLWFFFLACIVFWTINRVGESIQFSTLVTISLTFSNMLLYFRYSSFKYQMLILNSMCYIIHGN